MKLLDLNLDEEEVVFEISCSKGTYIRTVCENVAEKLNTVGYMKELRRVIVGEFEIQDSINIEDIRNNQDLLEERIVSIEKFFNDKEKIELNDKELQLFLNGVMITKQNIEDIYRIYNNDKFIGLGIISNNRLKRDIIL